MHNRINNNHFYESMLPGDMLFQKTITPMMIVDSTRTMIKANQQFCKLFGYEQDEVIGKRTVMLAPSEEYFHQYAKMFEQTRDGYLESSELMFKKSDYSLFWSKLTGIPLDVGGEKFVLWSFDDITQEVYARENLKRNNKELEVIFNRTNVGLMYVIDNVIQKANYAFLSMTDHNESIIGESVRLVIDDFDSCKNENKKKILRLNSGDDTTLIEREITIIDRNCYLVLLSDITSYFKEKETLTLLADIDGLTNVYNRRAFTELTQKRFTQLQYKEVSFAMLDADHFKLINDTWGHDVGDAVLQDLIALIKGYLREGEIIGRVGGDEFVILLPLDKEKSIKVCQRIIKAVARHRFTEKELKVTISMGLIDNHIRDSLDFESMYKAADRKLYEAKRSGRNRLVY